MSEEKNRELKIEKAIDSLPKSQWYKIEDIAVLSGLTIPIITSVINNSDDFVSSTDDQMQPVVTTRERFRKSEPFFRKVVGAFKNRID